MIDMSAEQEAQLRELKHRVSQVKLRVFTVMVPDTDPMNDELYKPEVVTAHKCTVNDAGALVFANYEVDDQQGIVERWKQAFAAGSWVRMVEEVVAGQQGGVS